MWGQNFIKSGTMANFRFRSFVVLLPVVTPEIEPSQSETKCGSSVTRLMCSLFQYPVVLFVVILKEFM